jgi:hypothetical protein
VRLGLAVHALMQAHAMPVITDSEYPHPLALLRHFHTPLLPHPRSLLSEIRNSSQTIFFETQTTLADETQERVAWERVAFGYYTERRVQRR